MREAELREENERLRALVGDSQRAFMEIMEYSTGWSHGQEGMCLLRIDDLARAQHVALGAKSEAPATWMPDARSRTGTDTSSHLMRDYPNDTTAGTSVVNHSAPAMECACRKALMGMFLKYVGYEGIIRDIDAALATPCRCEELRATVRTEAVDEFIDNHGVTCDCCQHVMIDVTAAKTGGPGHCVAGDPDGEGSACASGWQQSTESPRAELATARKDLAEAVEALRALRMEIPDYTSTVKADNAAAAFIARFDAQGGKA